MADCEKLTEFLWQHNYGGRWVNYSKDEIQALNRAVEKGRKTVTLPNSDDSRRILVDLVRMFQKNQTTKYEQSVRCLVFTDSFYSWQWVNSSGDNTSYRPHTVLLLEMARRCGQKTFSIMEPKLYLVDLVKLTQVNLVTGYSRLVIREELKSSLVPGLILKCLVPKEWEKVNKATDGKLKT